MNLTGIEMAEEKRYFAADAELEDERARLRLLEEGNDPLTIRQLTRLGVGAGWHCLEVGAGGGSIARWLAERVGPNGLVVATDIDLRFLDDLHIPNVEVRRHDLAKDALEEDRYDLVHCRALLFHLSDPEAVVTKMLQALHPGGWLLAEEGDLATFGPVDETCPFATGGVLRRMVDFARSTGIWNPFIGRQLPPMLARLGLTDVGNEVVTQILQGGHPMAIFAEKSFQRLDNTLLANGVATTDEIAARGSVLSDPAVWFVNHMMVSAWGRRAVASAGGVSR